MSNLIDRYDLGARVAPGVVAAFSLFLAVSAWIPFSEWPLKLLGGSAFLAIGAFVLAQVTRDAGKRIEPALWASWGGPPSVRMLRHRDPTFPIGSKSQIHRCLVELNAVDRIPTDDEEQQNPQAADAIYHTCSEWLRRKALELKAKAPFDVVHSENISYGFRRNLLGIKPYTVVIAIAALAVTVASFWFSHRPYIELCATVLVGAFLVLGVNSAFVKRAADEYAKRLLDAAPSLSPSAPHAAARPRKIASKRKAL